MEQNIIGERIKKRRKELKLRQRDVAARAGVSNVTICRYEKGEQIPDGYYMRLLAEALECETGYLDGTLIHPNRVTSDIAEQLPLSRPSIELLTKLKKEIDCTKGLNITESDSRLTAELIDVLIYGVVSEDDYQKGNNTIIIELMHELFKAIKTTSEYDGIKIINGQYLFGNDGMTVEEFVKFKNNPPDRYQMAVWQRDFYEQQIANVLKSVIHDFVKAVVDLEAITADNGEV